MALVWQNIDNTLGSRVYRAKFSGGWLVAFFDYASWNDAGSGYGYGYGGLTFIPDPNHEWDGNSLP